MTAEEKAKELFEGFAETVPSKIFGVLIERDWKTAKKCAFVCVEQLIEFDAPRHKYWQEVKEEIKKL